MCVSVECTSGEVGKRNTIMFSAVIVYILDYLLLLFLI